jgi:hypothetical protein
MRSVINIPDIIGQCEGVRDYTTISVTHLDQCVAAIALGRLTRPDFLAHNIHLAQTNANMLDGFVEKYERYRAGEYHLQELRHPEIILRLPGSVQTCFPLRSERWVCRFVVQHTMAQMIHGCDVVKSDWICQPGQYVNHLSLSILSKK